MDMSDIKRGSVVGRAPFGSVRCPRCETHNSEEISNMYVCHECQEVFYVNVEELRDNARGEELNKESIRDDIIDGEIHERKLNREEGDEKDPV